ncbi:hypothetical protein RQP46_007276 [Phenoliferia psychrophenolica]
MSLLKRMARSLKLGKEKFYVGRDLEGNSFYERPSTEYVDEWRKAKRTVEYLVERPLSEYRFASIPAEQNAFKRPQNPDSDFQPDSWSPAPRRR